MIPRIHRCRWAARDHAREWSRIRVIVEVCESNETVLHLQELENHGIDVVTYSCLDRCQVCVLRAFAFVDGDLLEADSAKELLGAVLARKGSEPASW